MDDSRAQMSPSHPLRAAVRQTLGWFASPKLAVMLIVGIAAVLAVATVLESVKGREYCAMVRVQEHLVPCVTCSAGPEYSGRGGGAIPLEEEPDPLRRDPCRSAGLAGRRHADPLRRN